MKTPSPYRAAGAYDGPSYVERDADIQLRAEISENRRFPFVSAPRQSGKSSLLLRTAKFLDSAQYTCAIVDLSTFEVSDYEAFWDQLLVAIERSAHLPRCDKNALDPEDVFYNWLESRQERLVVLIDEIDALIGASFKEQFFSKVRSLFNARALVPRLTNLQFVLAGTAHPSQLVKSRFRSPFNVGIEIPLAALTVKQVEKLSSHLKVDPLLPRHLHRLTSGSVYLCQLILENMWHATFSSRRVLTNQDVDRVIAEIVASSAQDAHFTSIYNRLRHDLELLAAFQRRAEGGISDRKMPADLRLLGICGETLGFDNEIYRQVFGPGGPLELPMSGPWRLMYGSLDDLAGEEIVLNVVVMEDEPELLENMRYKLNLAFDTRFRKNRESEGEWARQTVVRPCITAVDNLEQARRAVETGKCDLLIADYRVKHEPESNNATASALPLLLDIRKRGSFIPVIGHTAFGDLAEAAGRSDLVIDTISKADRNSVQVVVDNSITAAASVARFRYEIHEAYLVLKRCVTLESPSQRQLLLEEARRKFTSIQVPAFLPQNQQRTLATLLPILFRVDASRTEPQGLPDVSTGFVEAIGAILAKVVSPMFSFEVDVEPMLREIEALGYDVFVRLSSEDEVGTSNEEW